MSTTQTPAATVEVLAKDCNDNGTVFCPNPKMALWSNHPKVFIDLSHGGQGQCLLGADQTRSQRAVLRACHVQIEVAVGVVVHRNAG